LSEKIGKWAYALIEYDLSYKPLKSMKSQVVAELIVGHGIDKKAMNNIIWHVEKVKV
jgi:hypothetical protein